MKRADLVVIGGGVIGCAIAYYAARRGLSVTLVDQPKPGRATSASAGGLWPLGESLGLGCGVIFYKTLACAGSSASQAHAPLQLPECFLEFSLRSNSMFEQLTAELRAISGMDIEYERTSLSFLMYDELDVAFAESLIKRHPQVGRLIEWLEPGQLAAAEPAVTRDILGALRFHGDDQVNPYRLADALRAAARKLGATFVTHTEVVGLRMSGDRVIAVETAAGPIACHVAVNAAGAWAAQVGKMAGLTIPVRPIRGQIIGTESLPKILSSCLSTTDCYLAQKAHGEVIIGSTTEDVGFEVGVKAADIQTLAAGAVRAVPRLKDVAVKRAWSGLRPGTPDELPILGPAAGLEGYLNACGHFRTGILNSPLTGQLIAELAAGEQPTFDLEPFLLSRFAAETVDA
jgi:hydrogen cyanide synthase HcnC